MRKRRRVVMLCDVSQSMQSYAAAYLHLMRAVALTTDAEVFVFATTLTRLTSVLTYKSPVLAMQQATEKVADRFGGHADSVKHPRVAGLTSRGSDSRSHRHHRIGRMG